ncbi:unnamed protein product (macronuclear) [Paramecium tetraurelia]|uniref:Zinc-finger domain-containing protein n=1 Tax=Paramecium tetraurelia TaxID=5888 RepID=A0C589_PARTE|nr:uncharacterized protein GSPATT00006455001 [Paramecium tetraurelia]CAK65956.1 unnamed protein product [Paramecium tetraurelia]|eukprot:XP_001433353.1 hypothetical protein (macronuclear) [Paramecium tetraurelia strain d4-2]
MEKKVDSQFTSTFWRQIHQEYFMIETPITLDNMIKQHKINGNNFNEQAYELIQQVLKLKRKNKSKVQKLNDANLMLRLNLILMQREKSSEPIQQLIEEMVDCVCEDKLITELEKCSTLITNIHLLSEDKQIDIYYEEEQQIKSLHSQIDWPDQINQVIMELESDLISIQQKNTQSIQKYSSFYDFSLQTHVLEINNTLKFQYSIQQLGEFKLKVCRNNVQHHQKELDNLYDLIKMYEDYQVAESIVRAIKHQNEQKITVILDKYLSVHPLELTLQEFESYQRLREIHISISEQDYEYDLSCQNQDPQMCHYCRQIIEKSNQKQCTYNHLTMNLHQYNDELLTQQRYCISNQKMQRFYQDLYSANYIIEDDQIQCQKYFCYKCLKYEFDDYDISEIDWICPMCKGLCQCIRCQRNEVIYKLKRNLLEINGDLDLLYDQSLFEILVSNKRKSIQNIPLDFINNLKVYSETEEIFSSKNSKTQKIHLTKQIKKKKNSDTILVLPKYIQNVDSSSQSTKIKKQTKFRRLIPNDRITEDII